jgi:hypothetical protein
MARVPGAGRPKHSLAFLTLLSFISSFLAARAFTTIAPHAVVVTGDIHFHHFWYGLAMVVGAGWLAIVSDRPQLDRVLAIVFGLGAGLIGDEVGLLLTLGDYQSELTYVFFIGVLCFAGLGYLAFRYREQLEHELFALGRGERAVHLGVFVTGLSALAFAFGDLTMGLVILAVGMVMLLIGYRLHRGRSGSEIPQIRPSRLSRPENSPSQHRGEVAWPVSI